MARLLKYSSSRFQLRRNDYTYPELRAVRPGPGKRAARGEARNEIRSGFSRRERADAMR